VRTAALKSTSGRVGRHRSYRRVEERSLGLFVLKAMKSGRVALLESWLPIQRWLSRTRPDDMLLHSRRFRPSACHRQGRNLETNPSLLTLSLVASRVGKRSSTKEGGLGEVAV